MKKPKKKQHRHRKPRARAARRERSASAASRHPTPTPSRSPAPQGVELLESVDRNAELRNRLRAAASVRNEWAGIPMPLDGQPMRIAPGYPFAEAFAAITPAQPANPALEGYTRINSWWSHRRRHTVSIVEKDGKRALAFDLPARRLDMEVMTMGCAPAWGVEQESAAIHTLAGLVKHHAFKTYLLTGQFLETSPRSQVIYLFRRLRPTMAISFRRGYARILAALCMHPIGYYEESFAGAMCPTDDVIAPLMLMRGDEHMFWKRCSQHHPARPEAGL